MIKSKIWIFIYVISTAYCNVCRENCKQTRIQGLLTVDCYDQKLREVPHCLSSNVEVLDLSLNRIRTISESDLGKYSYLQILYLADNVITNISEGALQDKSDLHTLDLSYNVLYGIPRTLFHLSQLRKLYLSHVESPNMVEDIGNSRPIQSPLVYLDLSYNKLQRLPNLGVVPSLVTYNITGNERIHLSPRDFAGLCSLKLLVNDNTSPKFDGLCECWKAELWLKKRNVTFSSFNCKPAECPDEVAPQDLEIYNNCRKLHEAEMIKSFTSKLLTNIGIAAAVVILLLILTLAYVIRRRKQNKVPQNTKMLC